VTRPLRAGVVGYGYMGQIRHRNIANNPDTELAAICDPFCPDEVSTLKVPTYQLWQELLTADLDVVFGTIPGLLKGKQ